MVTIIINNDFVFIDIVTILNELCIMRFLIINLKYKISTKQNHLNDFKFYFNN